MRTMIALTVSGSSIIKTLSRIHLRDQITIHSAADTVVQTGLGELP